MRTLAAILSFFTVSAASAAPLCGMVHLAGTQVPLTDPVTFAPTTVDVYHVVVENPNPVDVYTYSLQLPGGPYLVGTQSVGRGTDFPQLGPFTVADSFLVANPNAPVGAVNPIGITDNESLLAGTVTVLAADPTNGNATVDDSARVAVPAGGSAVLAVLALPAGSPAPNSVLFAGSAVVDGALEEIYCVPEPAAVVLAVAAVISAGLRRRRASA